MHETFLGMNETTIATRSPAERHHNNSLIYWLCPITHNPYQADTYLVSLEAEKGQVFNWVRLRKTRIPNLVSLR